MLVVRVVVVSDSPTAGDGDSSGTVPLVVPLESRAAYESVVTELACEHPTVAAGDPAALASSVVVAFDWVSEPTSGLVRTYGSAEYDERVFYPADVIAFSQQPVERVERRFNGLWECGDTFDHSLFAMYTLALDLEDCVAEVIGDE